MLTLLGVLLAVFVLLRTPTSQTFLAQVASEKLSRELKTEIRISELTVNPKLEIVLKQILIKDQHQNPILEANKIKINLRKFNFRKRILFIDKVEILSADIRLAMYRDQDQMNYQFIIDSLFSGGADNNLVFDSIVEPKWQFKCDAIELQNSSFYFKNENKRYLDIGIDYNWVDVVNLDLNLSGFDVRRDSVFVKVENLNFSDRSGYSVEHFSGEFYISTTCIDAKNLIAKTESSNLDLDFHFEFKELADLSDFVNKVHITTTIRETQLDLCDIGFFAPIMFNMHDVFNLSANIEGTVSDFNATDFKFTFGNSTAFEGAISMKGLPFIKKTFCDVEIHHFVTSADDIDQFSLPFKEDNYIYIPDELRRWGVSSIIGTASGVYNNFIANIAIKSELGNLNTNMKVTNSIADSVYYSGRIQALRFDIGNMFDVPKNLGMLNLDASFNGSGLTEKSILLKLDGIIDSLYFRGNNYNNIIIDGAIANSQFIGHFSLKEEHLDLDFNGKVDFSQEIPQFNFYSKIEHAHLGNLNLSDFDSTGVLSTRLNIDFVGSKLDDMVGSINFDSIEYMHEGKLYHFDSVSLYANEIEGSEKEILIRSNILDATIKGKFLFKELITSVKQRVAAYLPVLNVDSSFFQDSLSIQALKFEINFKNTDNLSEVFFPYLKISPNSSIEGFYNSANQSIHIDANADLIDFMGIKFYDWFLKTNNDKNSFMVLLGSKDMVFKEASDSDTISLGLENLNLVASLQSDSINYRIRWDDFEESNMNKGYLAGYVKFDELFKSHLKLERADIIINDTVWQFNENNFISIDTSLIRIRNFGISTDQQELIIDGNISYSISDTITMVFKNWNVSNFDMLINNPKIDLDGIINGNLKFTNIFKSLNLESRIIVDDIVLNDKHLGIGLINTSWDKASESLFTEVEISNEREDSNIVELIGYYYPLRSENNFDANIMFNDFSLDVLYPFVSFFMSELDGAVSGNFLVSGSLQKPIFYGDLEFQDANATIKYTNVSYRIKNRVKFVENAILIDDVIIQDSLGRQATTKGIIRHNYFSDMEFDLNFYPDNMLGLNTNKFQNKLFYGTANMSGDLRLHGPPNQLILDANLTSEAGSEIFLPIDYDRQLSNLDFIVFVNHQDTIQEAPSYDVDLSGITLNLNLSLNQNVDVELTLPYQMGRIRADGEGEISLNVNSRGDFSINGDYFINEGDFFFSLQKIVKKKFSILEGGKISWTGNPYDAILDVKALYKTKASLADLGIRKSDKEASPRVNVNCYLGLQESLSDPKFKFGIELPNVDQRSRQEFFAIIDTTNEAQMNQQMVYLLALGSFSMERIFGNYTLGESSFRLISGQLSNLLSQISEDFDIGINYRPGDDLSKEELEVALSTQLFDNRLTIDGNLGVMEGDVNVNNNASSIVGDVNIEYKLTNDGKFRIRVFNRSNVNSDLSKSNTYDNIAPNTQGIGIFYRKDFNSFEQLFLGKEYVKKEKTNKKEIKKKENKEKK